MHVHLYMYKLLEDFTVELCLITVEIEIRILLSKLICLI